MKKETVLINSREYDLKYNKKGSGGQFWTFGMDNSGRGIIEIGLDSDKDTLAVVFLHEFSEAIMVDDGKRFRSTYEDLAGPNVVFHFDHDYFIEFCFKLFRAMESSGHFKFIPPVKEIAKK